jgi:hypothetical protein
MKRLLATLFIVSFYLSICQAQLGTQVGYEFTYWKSNDFNQWISDFSDSKNWYTSGLPSMIGYHTIVGGFRYKFDEVELSAIYRNRWRKLTASGKRPNAERIDRENLNISQNVFSVGLDFPIHKKFTTGFSLDLMHNYWRFSTTNTSANLRLHNSMLYGVNAHVDFIVIQNSFTKTKIRAFASIPFGISDFSNAKQLLSPNSDTGTKLNQTFFGLSLLFDNDFF